MDETKHFINLVMTVKKYPALYDLSSRDYHNRIVRNKMWTAVASEVNASAAACKEKWKHLRASFSRHLRNQSATGVKLKKAYYMADYMDFLLPFSKSRRRDEGLNEDETTPRENWNEEGTASNMSSDYEKPNLFEEMMSEVEESHARNADHEIPRNKLTSALLNDNADLSHKCYANCTVGGKQLIDQSIDDADVLFFKSLLPDIRQMTRQEKRNFKISVLELINKILSGRRGTRSLENDATPSTAEEPEAVNGN